MNLGEMDLEDAAQAAAGNWKTFECFAWHRAHDLPDCRNWSIIYTHNRDSGPLDQSNAAAIEQRWTPSPGAANPMWCPKITTTGQSGGLQGF